MGASGPRNPKRALEEEDQTTISHQKPVSEARCLGQQSITTFFQPRKGWQPSQPLQGSSPGEEGPSPRGPRRQKAGFPAQGGCPWGCLAGPGGEGCPRCPAPPVPGCQGQTQSPRPLPLSPRGCPCQEGAGGTGGGGRLSLVLCHWAPRAPAPPPAREGRDLRELAQTRGGARGRGPKGAGPQGGGAPRGRGPKGAGPQGGGAPRGRGPKGAGPQGGGAGPRRGAPGRAEPRLGGLRLGAHGGGRAGRAEAAACGRGGAGRPRGRGQACLCLCLEHGASVPFSPPGSPLGLSESWGAVPSAPWRKRARRNIEAGAGEDTDQGPNGLPRAGWTNLNGLSESKGIFAQEVLPGNVQGRQSLLISANNGRGPTQPCSRCLAGESGHFNHTVNC